MNLRDVSEITANSSNYTPPELSEYQKETQRATRDATGPLGYLSAIVDLVRLTICFLPMLFYAVWNDRCANNGGIACRFVGVIARAGMHFVRWVHLATDEWV